MAACFGSASSAWAQSAGDMQAETPAPSTPLESPVALQPGSAEEVATEKAKAKLKDESPTDASLHRDAASEETSTNKNQSPEVAHVAPLDTKPGDTAAVDVAPADLEAVISVHQDPHTRADYFELFLEERANAERSFRTTRGLAALATGAVLVPMGLVVESEGATYGTALWVAGALIAFSGTFSLFTPGTMEQFHETYRIRRGSMPDAELVARSELMLQLLAEDARAARHVGSWLGTTIGLASITTGVLIASTDVFPLQDEERRDWSVILIGLGSTSVISGISDMFVLSEVELVWRDYQKLLFGNQLPKSSTMLKLGFGKAGLGIGAAF